jgi:hypothetical protein
VGAGANAMRFESRELKSYAEPVNANRLVEGEFYFMVFLGRKLDPDDVEETLYFQDVDSYEEGARYGSPDIEGARFSIYAENEINHFFEFEHALQEMMKCSLRRVSHSGEKPNS